MSNYKVSDDHKTMLEAIETSEAVAPKFEVHLYKLYCHALALEVVKELNYNDSTQTQVSTHLNAYGIPCPNETGEWTPTQAASLLHSYFPDYVPSGKVANIAAANDKRKANKAAAAEGSCPSKSYCPTTLVSHKSNQRRYPSGQPQRHLRFPPSP